MSTPTAAEYAAERDRSYTVRQAVPLGAPVALRRPLALGATTHPAGLLGVVEGYANAGFRGIEATVLVYTTGAREVVPAGALELARNACTTCQGVGEVVVERRQHNASAPTLAPCPACCSEVGP